VTSGATSFADASSTVIHGSGNGPVVAFQTNETSASVLNGFTIEGGHNNPDNCALGGGVYINSTSPTISNNAVINNANYGVYVTGPSSPNVRITTLKATFIVRRERPLPALVTPRE
jgi:parallel beta-helix repeat protein